MYVAVLMREEVAQSSGSSRYVRTGSAARRRARADSPVDPRPAEWHHPEDTLDT